MNKIMVSIMLSIDYIRKKVIFDKFVGFYDVLGCFDNVCQGWLCDMGGNIVLFWHMMIKIISMINIAIKVHFWNTKSMYECELVQFS